MDTLSLIIENCILLVLISRKLVVSSANVVSGRVVNIMNSELEKIAYVYGDVCVRNRKQRRKRQKLLVTELLFDYAKNSTLHGLRYIVDKGLNIIERFFWLITVIASILLCSFYIYNVVQKWKTSPVIVTVNGRLSSVGSVPFPAVTICPQMKVNPQSYNYTDKYQIFRENESLWFGRDFEKFAHIDVMCDDNAVLSSLDFTNSSMIDDIIEAAPSIRDIFFVCSWHDTRFSSCSKLFKKVLTEDGVCFTANNLAARDIFENTVQHKYSYMDSNRSQMGWSLDDGYNYSSRNVFPRRGRVFGSDPDLSLIMINDPDKADKTCSKIYSGYKIYLHHPADFPQTSLYYYAGLPNQLSSVAVSFHEFNSDSDLEAYDTEIRQCYFPSDRKLRYFKIYTATNCLAECLSNHTYELCHCVGFYMPHNNSSEICHYRKYGCMTRAKDEMAIQERSGDLGLNEGCRCLPACNTVEYDAEILKTDFRIQEIFQDYMGFLDINPLTTYSKIDLFYKKPQFVTMQRRELFGVTDLLANIGGLMGVFLGFSFLSMIEIFYFLTVRVGFILRRDFKEEKSKQKLEKANEKGL